MYVTKTKMLINCAATAQLFCVFAFAYAEIRFSHDAAHISKLYYQPGSIFTVPIEMAQLSCEGNQCVQSWCSFTT